MANPIPVDLTVAYRLLNHGPTVLVTSAHHGKRNVMAASWTMPLDFSPPKVSVVIDKATYSRVLIEASGVFALNVPVVEMASQVLLAGSSSGRAVDKFMDLGLSVFPSSEISVPLIAGCAAWLECRVLPETAIQEKYDLFVAEVVAAWADPDLFKDGRWLLTDHGSPRTLHYVAGGQFFMIGDVVEVSRPRE